MNKTLKELPTAEEARKIVDEINRNKHIREQEEIDNLIIQAIQNGESYITIYNVLSLHVEKYLESKGYIVKFVNGGYNEFSTKIYWQY